MTMVPENEFSQVSSDTFIDSSQQLINKMTLPYMAVRGSGKWGIDAPMVVADFNIDGKPDIAVAYNPSWGAMKIDVLTGKTSPVGLNEPVEWWSNAGAWEAQCVKLVAGDFDGDGYPDLVAFYRYANANTGAWFFRNNQVGGFEAPVVWWSSGPGNWEWTSSKFVVGDFQGTGRDSIACLYGYATADPYNCSAAIWLFTVNGTNDGFNAPAVWWSSGAGHWNWDASYQIGAGKFYGSTRDDIIILYQYANANTGLWVLKNNGAGNIVTVRWWLSGEGNWEAPRSGAILVGDFDGDGKPDVVLPYEYGNRSASLFFFRNNANANFAGSVLWWNSGAGNWDAGRTKYFVADQNIDTYPDVLTMYYYGNNYTRQSFFHENDNGSAFKNTVSNWVGSAGELGEQQMYLYANRPINSLMSIYDITHAYLKLYQYGSWTNSFTLKISLLAEPYTGNSLTYYNRPDIRNEAAATISVPIAGGANGTLHKIDLVELFETIVEEGWEYYGFRINADFNQPGITTAFYTTRSTLKPAIEWSYSLTPDAPTELHPAAARSVVKPHFRGTANVAISGFQIQVDEGADFATPINNVTINKGGGDVVIQESRLIDYTPGVEFTALTSDNTYYWRCRVTALSSGAVGEWSPAIPFGIYSKPTLNITNVAADTTNDLTPTVAWDYTDGEGGIQSYYSVVIAELDPNTGQYLDPYYNGNTQMWVGGWKESKTSTVAYTTPPSGALKAGKTYRLTVSVKDTVVRDDDTTDNMYVTDSQVFSINTALGTSIPTNVAATLVATPNILTDIYGIMPVIKITWNCVSVPDEWRILRKQSDIIGDELIAQGTGASFISEYSSDSFEYEDVAPGGVDLVYTIQAVVNKQVSQTKVTNHDFSITPMTAWTLTNSGGAASTLERLFKSDISGSHYARINITADGGTSSDITLKQNLPVANANTHYLPAIRVRSREGNRQVLIEISKTASPYTVYDSEILNLTSEFTEFTFDWLVTEATAVTLTLKCGNDLNDVDIDYFNVYLPGTYATVTALATNGFWIIAEDDFNLVVPVTIAVDNSEVEYDEVGGAAVHPYGGYFKMNRTPQPARRFTLSGLISRDTGIVDNLETMLNKNSVCFLSSSKGSISRVLVDKKIKLKEVGSLHGKKFFKLDINCLEIGDFSNVGFKQ